VTLSVIALAVAAISLGISIYLGERSFASQRDENIMTFTSSVLDFLERVHKLPVDERRLFINFLEDWDYFAPPKKLTPPGTVRPSDQRIQELREHFRRLAESASE